MEEQIRQIITQGRFTIENGEEKVIFDCGPSVLKGVIRHDFIPENFKDNYKDIIIKSFAGYTDESTNITSKFSHENFTIDNHFKILISFNSKFYSFEKEIVIPLSAFNKDRVDYLEEKITQLTSKLESMEVLLTQMIPLTMSKHKFVSSSESIKKEIEDSESTDSSMDDLSDSEEEEQSKHKKTKAVSKKSSKSKRT